ncbi:asparagine synthase (glutamine-hydrolyzing) [Geomesophilobacter sediminis]|uniref:asparagine synthase (glutamine-hydrolyzing) n=1 Tax=Geomesophilobacter sediminis TaxID=2798584 RepID=A0A8J7M2J5_9BACT|nr:asparagine synthase (glutamine-hydrolyzing) [Geomesophilobacter sediminis]MBJ6727568.1 asparagine synthase (glutamine-hydrolyzing) [Geomesophilobacter sediminis]
MCGIFGMVSPRMNQAALVKATDTLAHRGPDDAGYHLDGEIGMGHRRLSIIDVAGSRQPIYNEDRTKCIVFNGEIYNFAELRRRLIALGHVFTTNGDTETILHAYEQWGESCVEMLRGMFAFAIWDSSTRTLFLSRDRFGIKPLFYGTYTGGFGFASEMKALLVDPAFPREMDHEGLAAYFSFSYIPGQMTIFRHIRKLLPGHSLTWRDGTFRIRKYWELKVVPDHGKSEEYFIEKMMEHLREAVGSHLVSEVPLGAFLSGGMDSSLVVALMSGFSEEPVNTFCMGFGGDVGGYLDERGYARQVAQRYRTKHREFEIIPRFDGLIETMVRAFDEPFADDSAIPTWFVCKTAREEVTVALSGLGGDEVFAGYERYLGFALSGWFSRLPDFALRNLLAPLVERLSEQANGHYTVNHMKRFVRAALLPPDDRYLGYVHKMRPGLQGSFFAEPDFFSRHAEPARRFFLDHFNNGNVADGPESFSRAMYCDTMTYLPEDILAVTDRMSMQHALEVRVPFLDHPFFEFCATIPPELKIRWLKKKYIMRSAAREYLPAEVITHRKQGFVGPMTSWLKTDLKPFVLETLSEPNLRRHGLLNPATVRAILDEHFSGREIHDTLIWSMLVFQTWHNLYL